MSRLIILCLDGGRWDIITSIPELLCCSSQNYHLGHSVYVRVFVLDVTQWLT